MTKNHFPWLIALLIAGIQFAILGWQNEQHQSQFVSLLNNNDLPYVANEWSLLLLPILTVICLRLTNQRIVRFQKRRAESTTYSLIGFVIAFNFGATLSGSYYLNMTDYAFALMLSVPLIALFVKCYRAECVLGFSLSMSIVFGGPMSLLLTLCLAVISFLFYTFGQYFLNTVKRQPDMC